ncbi:hypothetical protein N0V84_003232 [Fusarium piperis]|uniref:Uncharacterized protein n=1 Tax=Fusarium piperis TaxID=1435070 RepID=A0A9W9BQZ4_9HYPO|nr:hypothetical protein N0V84_003232 [Fusarium piperis]
MNHGVSKAKIRQSRLEPSEASEGKLVNTVARNRAVSSDKRYRTRHAITHEKAALYDFRGRPVTDQEGSIGWDGHAAA